MKLEKPLLMTVKIPDPDNAGQEKEIQTFTQEGLAVAVEYYNQKYPHRGEIKQLLLPYKVEGGYKLYCEEAGKIQSRLKKIEQFGLSQEQEKLKQDLDAIEGHLATIVVNNSLDEIRSFKGLKNQKIITTIANQMEDGRLRLDHSNPFVLTEDKLILMRDDHSSWGKKIYEKIAEELGVKLVYQLPVKEKGEEGRTSMQGDKSSCHFIACGVLKDLTSDDMKQVAGFEDGYQPLPKMLKYSQSAGHLDNVLQDKDLRESISVKDKIHVTVAEYVDKYKKVSTNTDGKQFGHRTRISDKASQFIGLLEKFETILENAEQTPGKFAAKILEEQQQKKLQTSNQITK